MTPFSSAYRKITLFLLSLALVITAVLLTCSHNSSQVTAPSSHSIAHTSLTQGVKNLWLNQEGQRLQTTVTSENSTVAFLPCGTGLEVVECMRGVTSWMQRKITNSGQQVRYLKADEATFLYQSQKFLTQNVSLTLYNAPGIMLSLDTPTSGIMLKGVARELNFKLGSSDSSEVFATDFRAEVNSP